MTFNRKRVFLTSTLAALLVLLPTAGYVGFLSVRAATPVVNQARVQEVVSRIRAENERSRNEAEQKLLRGALASDWPEPPLPAGIDWGEDNVEPIREERQRLHDPAYKWNSRDK
jgi:hypothetical protein